MSMVDEGRSVSLERGLESGLEGDPDVVEFTDAEVQRQWFNDRNIPYEMVTPDRAVRNFFQECALPNVVIGRAWGDGVHLERGQRLVRSSSVDDVTIAIHRGPGGRIEQDGSQVLAGADTGTFYTSASPMRIRRAESSDNLMIMVDRRRLRQITGQDVPLGLQVPASNVGLSLLSSTAFGLLSAASALSAEEGEHYSRALMDLLGAVVRSSRSGPHETVTGPEALLEQLKADVFARLGDPDLGPSDLAARHSISLRYVHRLFGAEPPAAFIRRQRMVAAGDLLARSATATLPISSVAARSGFRDTGTFIRAFRRHYGCTPSEYRELSLVSG
jgi:AraC-like DNA-binding protein